MNIRNILLLLASFALAGVAPAGEDTKMKMTIALIDSDSHDEIRLELDGDELVPACVNPANIGGGEESLAGGYFGATVEGVGTPFELIEDYYTAECATSATGLPYLEIDARPDPGDTRDLNHIESYLADAESLHGLDYNFALGDLLALVQSQAASYGL